MTWINKEYCLPFFFFITGLKSTEKLKIYLILNFGCYYLFSVLHERRHICLHLQSYLAVLAVPVATRCLGKLLTGDCLTCSCLSSGCSSVLLLRG